MERGLCLSFATALLHMEHDKQHLSLHSMLSLLIFGPLQSLLPEELLHINCHLNCCEREDLEKNEEFPPPRPRPRLL